MTGHTRRGTRTRSFDETLGNNASTGQPPRGPSAPVRTPHGRDRSVAPGGMGVANSDVLLAALQGITARFGVEQAAAFAALHEAMTGQVRERTGSVFVSVAGDASATLMCGVCVHVH